MESHKIIGYILLVMGIIILFSTLYQSYSIFTGKVSAPLVFKVDSPQKNINTSSAPTMDQQFNNAIANQLKNMLPLNSIPNILNLFSWAIFAGILIFGSGQIASIGIKMIK